MEKIPLAYPFYLCTVSGLWYPQEFKNSLRKSAFRIWQCIVFFCLFVSSVLEFIFVFQSIRSKVKFEEYNDVIFVSATGNLVLFKFITTNFNRQKILDLRNELEKGYFKPQDEVEIELERKYEVFIS